MPSTETKPHSSGKKIWFWTILPLAMVLFIHFTQLHLKDQIEGPQGNLSPENQDKFRASLPTLNISFN